MEKKKFYFERLSEQTYFPPFTYDKKNKYIVNSRGEAVATIHLGHAMYTLNKDRDNFGETLTHILNNNLYKNE